MYESYFGMSRRPFRGIPQPGCYYPASGAEEAIATLRYCLNQGRGIGLLTGLPGTGKTTICQLMAEGLEATATCLISNTHMTNRKALLQSILYGFTLPYRGLDEQELRMSLSDFLIGTYAAGGKSLVIVDEAHNLPVDLLEEIRMLGNLQSDLDRLLQVVMVGQPEMLEILERPEMDSLAQRVGAKATLEPLSEDETMQYVGHQLEWSGVQPERVFSLEAAEVVYQGSDGIPRLINQICDHALLTSYVAERTMVDQEMVERALAHLNREASKPYLHLVSEQQIEQQLEEPAKPAGTDPEPVELDEIPEPATAAETDRSPTAQVQPAEAEPMVPGWVVADPTVSSPLPYLAVVDTNSATSEQLVREETIFDPYAELDDALSRMETVASPQPAPALPSKPQATVQSRDASPKLFIGAGDEAPSFEVGEGDEAEGDSEILIIEDVDHSGKRARLDPAEVTPKRTGVYRRLFTHVKKG